MWIVDLADRMPMLCDDTNLKVRVRAFWALGALADALIEMRADANIFISEDSVNSLLRASIAGCSDQEKVRSHAFRSLGRIVCLIPSPILHDLIPVLEQAVSSLISNLNMGSFKTRWNACYCLGNLMECDGFPLGAFIPYTESLLSALLLVSATSLNFKVKAGALWALARPRRLQRYASPESVANVMLIKFLKGLQETANSVEIVLARSSIDEQKCLNQFIEAFNNLLKHLRAVDQEGWTEEMTRLETDILYILSTTGKFTSCFDPNGK